MKKRVAIIDPLGAHGSSHHLYLYGQLYGLKQNNVDVALYTNIETKDPKIEGVVFLQSFGNLFSSKYKFITAIKYIIGSLRSILHARTHSFSIFHFHVFHADILMLFNVIASKLLFGKVVLTVHDVESFSKVKNWRFIAYLIYRLANLVLTHNEFSKQELIRSSLSLKCRVLIVPHGNYTPFINIINDKEGARKRLKLPHDKTILLFFGMIKEVKGLDVLLQSLKNTVLTNPHVVLLIAGRVWHNDFNFYQQIIDKNNLADNVILHTRFIAQDDVKSYYCASDLVVLPYKKIYQSGVLMMTLSYKKPALVSNLPPFQEIITDNENGFIFKSQDVDDLSIRLSAVLSDQQNLERVRKNGSRLINEKFNWVEIGKMTRDAYQSL